MSTQKVSRLVSSNQQGATVVASSASVPANGNAIGHKPVKHGAATLHQIFGFNPRKKDSRPPWKEKEKTDDELLFMPLVDIEKLSQSEQVRREQLILNTQEFLLPTDALKAEHAKLLKIQWRDRQSQTCALGCTPDGPVRLPRAFQQFRHVATG
ncbi:MAG: hypothetical protein NT077_02910 [Candidatus Taylorbacteria bacterium]|nr:hypothetical protein [Candidatus Taylorbacteria bacterium]